MKGDKIVVVVVGHRVAQSGTLVAIPVDRIPETPRGNRSSGML